MSVNGESGRGRSSAVRQKELLDVVAVGLEHHARAAQLTDLLGGPLDHAVALTRVRRHDLSGTRDLEALLGARLGLHLGHLALLCRRRKSGVARVPDWCSELSVLIEHFAAATAALGRATG